MGTTLDHETINAKLNIVVWDQIFVLNNQFNKCLAVNQSLQHGTTTTTTKATLTYDSYFYCVTVYIYMHICHVNKINYNILYSIYYTGHKS